MGSRSTVLHNAANGSYCLRLSSIELGRGRGEKSKAYGLSVSTIFARRASVQTLCLSRTSAHVQCGQQSLPPFVNHNPATTSDETFCHGTKAGTVPECGSSSQPVSEVLWSQLWQAAGVTPFPPLLQMHTSPAGVRGLAVKQGASIAAGQLLLAVPLASLLLVPKEAGRNKSGRPEAAGAAKDCGEADCRLAVKLLVEVQQQNSVWHHYAQLLPTTYESVAEWTPAELVELQSEAAVGAARAAAEEWHHKAARIREAANQHLDTLPPAADLAVGTSSLGPLSRSAPPPLSPPALPHESHPGAVPPEHGLHFMDQTAPSAAAFPAEPSSPVWAPPLSHSAALWALRTVLTRSFSTSLDGTPVQCLVPVADMLNHAPPQLLSRQEGGPTFPANPSPVWPRSHSAPDLGFAQWRLHHQQGSPPGAACFQVFASAPLTAGQEATIFYGPHTSLELLISCGFVPGANPADRVPLYHSLQEVVDDVDARVPLARQKEELLFGAMGTHLSLSADADGAAPRLLECLYVLHAGNAAELAGLEAEWHRCRSLSSARVSRPTRAAAARQVVQRCAALLEQHATALDKDQRLWEQLEAGILKTQGLDSGRFRLALRLRMLRKETLARTRERYAPLAGLIAP